MTIIFIVWTNVNQDVTVAYSWYFPAFEWDLLGAADSAAAIFGERKF